jgi:ADP-ribosylglycohydrolase
MVALPDSYEQVVQVAVSLGDATDTNLVVAGGLARIRDGQPAIPPRCWMACAEKR